MSLTQGMRLGPYEILTPIGAGGMGEVYQARDTRLDRTVAVKVSSAQFSERFDREARAVAALNHPHICTLYDVGPDYLVMELVEGPTVAERIRAGALPLEEALEIAGQIAEALEAAHDKGIVHRDLKPANVKLTAGGQVKVLDFGLAKAFDSDTPSGDPASSPTLTLSATRTGLILGTAAYMAPEQARGASVDKRADLWAFGVLLYEMLTGRQTFTGETISDTLAAVLRAELDWRALPANTPASIRRLLRRCLERDRKKRLRDAGDARLEIEEALAAPAEEPAGPPAKPQRLLWALAALAVIACGAALWAWLRAPAPAPRPVMRWTAALPSANRIPDVSLAPDESSLIYTGTSSGPLQVFARSTDQLEAKPISGTDSIFSGHFYSPDGRWIVYYSTARQLKKVPVTGGASITLCETSNFYGGSWGPDDTIVFAGGGDRGLMRIPAAGGKPELLAKADPSKGEMHYGWPWFLPGGKALLFTIRTAPSWDDSRVGVLNLRTGERRVLLDGGSCPRYAPTGHLVYAHAGSLFAVPFDAYRLQVKGTPAPVLEGISWLPSVGFADYSFSALGELVYVAGSGQSENRTLVWVDRKGTAEPLPAPPRAYSNPVVSPDGRRVAVSIVGEQNNWDIWTYDLGRPTLTRLTFGPFNFAPAWTPDGRRVAFRSRDQSGKNGIFWVAADGSGAPEQLAGSEGAATPGSFTPDGGTLIFEQGTPQKTDLWTLSVPRSGSTAAGKPEPFLQITAIMPQFSPDGRWVAYVSNESGTAQVYVQPFPGPGGKWQISTDGGTSPRWARSGRELFYRNGDKMMAVEVETKPTFRALMPRLLFEGRYDFSAPNLQPAAGYDVSPDGKRFLMVKSSGDQAAPAQVQVVQNWFEELKRRVPAGK